MKKSIIYILFLISLFSCQNDAPFTLVREETIAMSSRQSAVQIDQTPPKFPNPVFKDISGKVSIKIFVSPRYVNKSHRITIAVESGYVLVGGGGFIENTGNELLGGFITECRPETDLKRYYVSSTSPTPEYFALTAYAIGLKIEGVSENTLRSNMKVFQKSGNGYPTPVFSEVSDDFKLIGGGARSDSSTPTAPLITSISNGEGWLAQTMLLSNKNPETATSFSIGIKKSFLTTYKLVLTKNFINPKTSIENYKDLYYETVIGVAPTDVMVSFGLRNNSMRNYTRGIVSMYPVSGTLATLLTKTYQKKYPGINYGSSIGLKSQ
jgi:hypothetical protein